MKGLSKRQHELLLFIEEHIAKHHFSPSYQEIMNHFGFTSPGTVYKHLQVLKRKGAITTEEGKARSCRPTLPTQITETEGMQIPLIGTLRLHYPIEMHEKQKHIFVHPSQVKGCPTPYAFHLKGNEWSDEYLSKGDILFIDPTKDPTEDDTILATEKNGEVLLRRLQIIDTYFQLISKNPHLQPLVVRPTDLHILGVVLSAIRFF